MTTKENADVNKCEFKGTTSSTSVTNDSARYPFANEPTNTLQNMNYKEWLTTLEGGNNQGLPNVVERGSSASELLKLGGTVVGRILGLIPGVGSYLSFLSGVLWPTLPSDTSIWEAIMEAVEVLVDEKIQESVRKDALARLEGLGLAVKVYQESLASWLENPNNTRASVVRQQFVALELDFVEAMPFFRRPGDEVLLLATYAQAANLHLALLRDASLYGIDWGMTSSEVATFYNRQTNYIAEYSDHCVNFYKKGLDELWLAGPYGYNWQKFNEFRLEMTIAVLDLVALFPKYDWKLYPIKTNTELTREIYTSGINVDIDPGWIYKEPLELNLTNSPKLFTWLKKFDLYTNVTFNARWRFLSATRRHYLTTGLVTISSEPYEGFYFEGLAQSTFELKSGANNLPSQDIYKITVRRFGDKQYIPTAITDMTFYKNDNTIFSYSANTPSGEPMITSDFYLPGIDGSDVPTTDNYSHRLSTINTYNTTNQSFYHTFGWTHVSVNKEHILTSDKITQIPLVKGSIAPSVVKGSGHTGGDLVVVQPGRGEVSRIKYKSPIRKYQIRLRYAANSPISIELNTSYETTTIKLQKTFNLGEENNLKYNNYRYAFAENTVVLGQGVNPSLKLQNVLGINQSDKAYLDKIEFIPVDETYEAEQDLENAKKAMNALFTNTKDGLRPGVTDYEVNQAAILVECLSDDLYPNEKRLLFDAVKEAKCLSQARNVLQDPDF